tara:strand:+ start:189 stop:797 length:609 start_codon:yes stop_codon:yes gene_type:complete
MGVISNGTTLLDAGALDSGIAIGGLRLLSTLTASSSATLDFTSGLTSTYDHYIFKFTDIHPATDGAAFSFQADTGTNTSYNQNITSTFFRAVHSEADDTPSLAYVPDNDLAGATSFQVLANGTGNGNDECLAGTLTIFSPASTVLVKHFTATANELIASDQTYNLFCAGYFNQTAALTRVRFKMSSGNIDSGTIKLYGVYSG